MDKADGSAQKIVKVWLLLRVQGYSSFVRGESRARRAIERNLLAAYQMQKLSPRGSEYELRIPYESDEELNQIVEELLVEASSTADSYDCFIEADARAMDGSERYW